jgi:hypothetical protein
MSCRVTDPPLPPRSTITLEVPVVIDSFSGVLAHSLAGAA